LAVPQEALLQADVRTWKQGRLSRYKLTRGVWSEIARGGYVAQSFAAPGERTIEIDGRPVSRKIDVRLYTYAGRTLLAATRLYQGQTTNFRTEGGGFAPVFAI
jgi:hypothetical protein